MQFPKDHNPHNSEVEWWYVWGKLNNVFIHWALFKKGKKLVVHSSVRNEGVEFCEKKCTDLSEAMVMGDSWMNIISPQFKCECAFDCLPQIHEGYGREYYSIPKVGVKDGGLWGDGWFDHAWGDIPTEDWHWVSIKFNDGSETIITGTEQHCRNILKENSYLLNMIGEEEIFQPKHGWPYSEQPFILSRHEETIGHGMLERTYRRKEKWRGR